MKKTLMILYVVLSLIVMFFLILIVFNFKQQTDKAMRIAMELEAAAGQPIEAVDEQNDDKLKLGAFSISLSVKNLDSSRQFYEKFGFTKLGGGMEQNYLIMKNENAVIGLFLGMFEGNILTFNPGWDENGKDIERFNDIREIQSRLTGEGVKIDSPIDTTTEGPASLMLTDPEGNVILLDQHR